MQEQIVAEAIKLSDSIFLVLLIGLAGGTWWIIRYVFRKNDEREMRYITVIDKQAEAMKSVEVLGKRIDGIGEDVKQIKAKVGV